MVYMQLHEYMGTFWVLCFLSIGLFTDITWKNFLFEKCTHAEYQNIYTHDIWEPCTYNHYRYVLIHVRELCAYIPEW